MAANDMRGVIFRGINSIRAVQLADGSIAGRSSASIRPFKPQITYHTTFTPAIILGALADIPEAKEVRDEIAGWLMEQRSPNWSFNYWARTSKEFTTMQYPDDLDDTFCTLIGLHNHNPSLITADVLGNVVRLLIAAEDTVGGPYRTWLATPDSDAIWKDVDIAVNSNIAYFLRLVAEPLPNVTAYLETAIRSGAFTSPYYPAATPLLYYLARAYRGPHEQALAAHIRKQPVDTPLHTALIISALLELGHHAELGPAVDKLRSWQNTDGSWPAEAYCIDPARRGTTFYHGSKALTTALAIEALHRYSKQQTASVRRKSPVKNDLSALSVQIAMHATAKLDEPLRSHARSMLETTVEGDETHEIVGIPYQFMRSLAIKQILPTPLLAGLGAANLFGWLAYTIYDDFLDDEGKPVQLSVANIALRRSLDGFLQSLPTHDGFQKLVHRTFDCIDAANAWEVTHCRFPIHGRYITIGTLPRYGQRIRLAERSLGHTLGPLAIMSSIGYAPSSAQATAIRQMLTHYLIARQLNDDVHDWEQDLRRGHISYVVQVILRALRLKHGQHSLETLLPRAQRQFWHRSLPGLCDITAQHVADARAAANASGLIAPGSPIFSLFERLESIIEHTRSEQTKAEQFLNAYRKK